jgi:kanamycin kinase
MTRPSRRAVPIPVRFGDWDPQVAWQWEDRVTTWRLERDGKTSFLKVLAFGAHPTLADERDRLVWVGDRIRVPRVLDYGVDDGCEWLLLEPVPGRDATHPDIKADPRVIVPILARGLRAFHDIDPTGCPFDFRIDAALQHVRDCLEAGVYTEDYEMHDEFVHLNGAAGIAHLEAIRPPSEDVVVCHGDYCFPNVLIDDDWRIVGYLDVGELGLADRWWDIAVGAWSVTWNVGPGWEDLFYQSYGVEPDARRIEFYRLLYSLSS